MALQSKTATPLFNEELPYPSITKLAGYTDSNLFTDPHLQAQLSGKAFVDPVSAERWFVALLRFFQSSALILHTHISQLFSYRQMRRTSHCVPCEVEESIMPHCFHQCEALRHKEFERGNSIFYIDYKMENASCSLHIVHVHSRRLRRSSHLKPKPSPGHLWSLCFAALFRPPSCPR